MDSDKKQKAFNEICKNIEWTYHEELNKFLTDSPNGELTDADVIVMIMNLTISISTNAYYSLKQFLPNTKMDFDFMRAKIINSLVDSFDKIKEFTPKDKMIPLTVEQLEEIQKNGFCIVIMSDGSERMVMKEEIKIKRKDADKIKEAVKTDTLHAGGNKKIFIPPKGTFSKKH